ADSVVRLIVSDNGPGIGPDILPRIFEPFFTTKPVGQGTGLGLSISYRIIEAHAGRLWAERAVGHGATLIVELPIHRGESPAARPPSRGPLSALSSRRVLVIDDEAEVAHTLRALFESLGQHVTVALGGECGWEH